MRYFLEIHHSADPLQEPSREVYDDWESMEARIVGLIHDGVSMESLTVYAPVSIELKGVTYDYR